MEIVYKAGRRNSGRVEIRAYRAGKLFGGPVGPALLVPVECQGLSADQVCRDLNEGEFHPPILSLTEEQARNLTGDLLRVQGPLYGLLNLRDEKSAMLRTPSEAPVAGLIEDIRSSHRLLLEIVARQFLPELAAMGEGEIMDRINGLFGEAGDSKP